MGAASHKLDPGIRYLRLPPSKKRKDIGARFGLRIRDLRQKQKMTQAGMSQKFGLDRSYISDLERGRKSISLPMIEVIALGFEISLEELFKDL